MHYTFLLIFFETYSKLTTQYLNFNSNTPHPEVIDLAKYIHFGYHLILLFIKNKVKKLLKLKFLLKHSLLLLIFLLFFVISSPFHKFDYMFSPIKDLIFHCSKKLLEGPCGELGYREYLVDNFILDSLYRNYRVQFLVFSTFKNRLYVLLSF